MADVLSHPRFLNEQAAYDWVEEWAPTPSRAIPASSSAVCAHLPALLGKHLHRYLAEFDYRYSNRVALGVDDTERATHALKGEKGKRLTCQTTRRD